MGQVIGLVESDGSVELIYDYAPELIPAAAAAGGDLWRYRSLLPLEDGPIRYPLAVGGTPLTAPPRLREALAMPNLFLKDESRGPTGSNKDRATALVLEQGLRRGASTVTCASTGNVAVSLAVGAAAAGMKAVIFVPAKVYDEKLQIMLFAGATVIKVEEGYVAAFELSRAAARQFGWLDRNTGVNPATLEAKKTVAFEIWEQLGREVPDVVVVPVGDGPTLSAVAKGFRELCACGVTRRVPRLLAVQAAGCQPLKRAWETGGPIEAVEPHTIADGIAVSVPISGRLVLRDVRETRGAFVAVEDSEMLDAIRQLATLAGILAEPAGAAALAGLRQMLEAGLVGRNERVVVLVTGSGLKTAQFLRSERTTLEVSGSLDEVEALL